MGTPREVLNLTYEDHRDIICGDNSDFAEIRRDHEGTSRHTEQWSAVFQRKSDLRYFAFSFSTSVKDEMGWRECNEFGDYSAMEVFPTTVTTIIYS